MWQINHDQQRLEDLLPQVEALKDALLEDAERLVNLEELMRAGVLQKGDPEEQERVAIQDRLIANREQFNFLLPICRQLQVVVGNRLRMLEISGY